MKFQILISTCGIVASVCSSTCASLYSRLVTCALCQTTLVGGGGETELHAIRILLVRALDLRVVDQHQRLARLLDIVELAQAGDRLV